MTGISTIITIIGLTIFAIEAYRRRRRYNTIAMIGAVIALIDMTFGILFPTKIPPINNPNDPNITVQRPAIP